MTNVMTNAWEIAYEGVAKFGGEVKEYFAEALRIAWDLFKKGGREEMHTDHVVNYNNGKTDLVISVRHINKEVEKSDFCTVPDKIVDSNKIEIVGVELNGENIFQSLNSKAEVIDHYKLGLVIRFYNVTINGKRHATAAGAIDEVTKRAVYAPYEAKREALKVEKVSVKKSSYEEQLCNSCGSICHGDCQEN